MRATLANALTAPRGNPAVTIALDHKLRGYSRTGGFLLRRATRAKLDEALEGLEEVLSAG